MTTGPNTEFFARHGVIVGGNTRIRVAVGNTSQRPANAEVGDTRYNSELDRYEGYFSNGVWGQLTPAGTLPDDATFVSSVTVGNSTQNTTSNSTTSTWNGGSSANSLGFYTGSVTVNSAGIYSGANVVVNSTMLGIGNSTVNFLANSTTWFFTGTGSHSANSSTDRFGNSTVYHSANTTADSIVDPASNASLLSTGLSINGGNAVVNSSGLFVSTTMVVNSSSFFTGNSTQNAVVNSSGIWLSGTQVTMVEAPGSVKYSIADLSGSGYLDQTNSARTLAKTSYANLYSALGDVWMANSLAISPASVYWMQDNAYFMNAAVSTLPASRFLNGEYFFFGSGYNLANVARIFHSTDGMFYKNTVPFGTGANTTVLDMAYGNGVYVAIGSQTNSVAVNASPQTTIALSRDLQTWTTAGSPSINSTMRLTSIEYGNGNFVVVGNTSAGNGFLLTSANANTWAVSFESNQIPTAFMAVYNGQGYWFLGCRFANLSGVNGVWASDLNSLSSFSPVTNGVYSNSTANTDGYVALMGTGNTSLGEVVWLSVASNTTTTNSTVLVRATNNSVSSLTRWSSDFLLASAVQPNNATTIVASGNNRISTIFGSGTLYSGVNFGQFPRRILYSKNTYSFTYRVTTNTYCLTATIDAVNTTATWNLGWLGNSTFVSDLLYSPTIDRYAAMIGGLYQSAMAMTYSMGRPDSNVWLTTTLGGSGTPAAAGAVIPAGAQTRTLIKGLNSNLVAFTPVTDSLTVYHGSSANTNYLWLSVSQSGDLGNSWVRVTDFQVANALQQSNSTLVHDAAYGNGTYVLLMGLPKQVTNASTIDQLNLYYSTNLSSWAQSTITPAGWVASPISPQITGYSSFFTANNLASDMASLNRITYGNGSFYVGVSYWSNSATLSTFNTNTAFRGWMYGTGASFTKSGDPSTYVASPAFPQYSNGILAFQNQANAASVIYSTDGVTPIVAPITFESITTNPILGNTTLEVGGGGVFVYSSYASFSNVKLMAVTSDFQTWRTLANPPWLLTSNTMTFAAVSNGSPLGITYVQNTFVKFSYGLGTVYVSKNAVDWEQTVFQTQSLFPANNHIDVNFRPAVINNCVYVDAGLNGFSNSEYYFVPRANSSQFNVPRIPAAAPGVKSWVKT